MKQVEARSADERRIAAISAELGLVGPIVTALPGGLANRSFRLRDARQDLVLRFAATTALGAERATEVTIHALAARAGLAPAIVLARPDEGLIVTRHIAGRTPGRAELHDEAFLGRLGAWIARLQAQPVPAGLPAVDFGERAAGYLAALQTAGRPAQVPGIAKALADRRAALAPPARLVVCHHDLHGRNLLDSGQGILAFDWEYAGPGDAAADLVACIRYHDLESPQVRALLAGYGDDGPAIHARVETLGWIFDCLCYGWQGVAELEGLEADPYERDALARRLTV